MTSAQSSNTNFSETDFNLLEDSEDADNHTSDTTATRLSLQVQLDESYLGNVSTKWQPCCGVSFHAKT